MRFRAQRIGIILLQLVSTTTVVAGGVPEPLPSGPNLWVLIPSLILLLGVILIAVRLWRGKQRSESQSHIDFVESTNRPPVAQARSGPQTDREKQRGVAPINPTSLYRAPSSVLGTVFISYRRTDSSDIVGRIYDRLVQRFDKNSIFKDVDSIPLGVDFRKHLSDSVGKCQVLLAVIGKNWLTEPDGHRRLDEATDFVRIEIESALQRDIPVIPVLVQGVTSPGEDKLPPTLRGLAYRQAISVRPDPDFHRDMDRLIEGIESHLRD